jgi:tRNA uridine 5-carbamoylmethylation protein Kti12
MSNAELLILNGSPGSGKSTLADAIAEQLRQTKTTHAIIDADEIARAYPGGDDSLGWHKTLMRKNLAAIWPNYTVLDNIKIIIPLVIDNDADLTTLKAATPGCKLIMCELVAPIDVLKKRVTAREPNDYWQEKLRGLVDRYNQRKQSNAKKYADFEVSTHNKNVQETAIEIITKLGW